MGQTLPPKGFEDERLFQAFFENSQSSLLSHDIRGITNNLSRVLDSHNKQEVTHETLLGMLPELRTEVQINQRAVENVLHLVRNLEDGDVKPENIHVYRLYTDLVKRLNNTKKTKNLQILYQGDRSLIIKTDAYLISFILLRILENAVKYSYYNGYLVFFGTSLGKDSVKITIGR